LARRACLPGGEGEKEPRGKEKKKRKREGEQNNAVSILSRITQRRYLNREREEKRVSGEKETGKGRWHYIKFDSALYASSEKGEGEKRTAERGGKKGEGPRPIKNCLLYLI